VRLEPGDRLYFATDGLMEAENTAGKEFGTEKLMEAYDQNRRRPLDDSPHASDCGRRTEVCAGATL